jgi:hypothetical protein
MVPDIIDIGWSTGGGGTAITYLNADPRPDLVMMAIKDNPEANDFYYSIAWDINGNGTAASWGNRYGPNPWRDIGWKTTGGGLAVGSIDHVLAPDLLFLALTQNSNGADNFRYTIAWNINPSGDATSWSELKSPQLETPWTTEGAGATIADIDRNGIPDLILMAIDHP